MVVSRYTGNTTSDNIDIFLTTSCLSIFLSFYPSLYLYRVVTIRDSLPKQHSISCFYYDKTCLLNFLPNLKLKFQHNRIHKNLYFLWLPQSININNSYVIRVWPDAAKSINIYKHFLQIYKISIVHFNILLIKCVFIVVESSLIIVIQKQVCVIIKIVFAQ